MFAMIRASTAVERPKSYFDVGWSTASTGAYNLFLDSVLQAPLLFPHELQPLYPLLHLTRTISVFAPHSLLALILALKALYPLQNITALF
ncbi:hypothetical protein FRC02_007777, partial [Tulasnella sp. 418]